MTVLHEIHFTDKTVSLAPIFQVIYPRLTVGRHVFSTHDENVITSEDREYMSAVVQRNHEEADPLIMIHVLDVYMAIDEK